MRHRLSGRQFGRNSSHRKALFRSLVTSLLMHEKIETTVAKAKEIRGITDRMITLGKRGDLHAKRIVLSYISNRDVVAKLFEDIAKRTANRPGGFTRIMPTRRRLGDSAEMAIIELVDGPGKVYSGPASKPKKKAKPAPAVKVEAAPATEAPVEAPAEESGAEAVAEVPAEEAVAEAPAEAPAEEPAAEAAEAPAEEAPADAEEKKPE